MILLFPIILNSFKIIKLQCLQLHRLQTGMRGAFGKAHGTCARVRIGQILLSVRSHDKHKVCMFFSSADTTFKSLFYHVVIYISHCHAALFIYMVIFLMLRFYQVSIHGLETIA